MSIVFADTYFYLAFLGRDDRRRERARQVASGIKARQVTTAWALMEVADAMTLPLHRHLAVDLIATLRADPNTIIVSPDESLFQSGLDLYAERPDKDWPLTDCISFVVMQEMGITDALTADHHFEQAGFVALLK